MLTRDDQRQVSSPRGPRSREDLPFLPRSIEQEDHRGSPSFEQSGREKSRSTMNPLEKLFKKRFLDKSQRDSPTITPPVVPAITIEAPVSTCHKNVTRRSTYSGTFSSQRLLRLIPPLRPQARIQHS